MEAAKHAEAVRYLHQQMQGEQQRHKQEAAEELADARRQDADYKAWLAAEAAKEAATKQGMLKLKARHCSFAGWMHQHLLPGDQQAACSCHHGSMMSVTEVCRCGCRTL